MSDMAADPRLLRAPPKRGLRISWADERFRAIIWQVLIVGIVFGVIWWLVGNTRHNLEVRRIATGFGFLTREAGLPIAEHAGALHPGQHLCAGLAGRRAEHAEGGGHRRCAGHHLGTLIGIARLSKNWLLSRIAATYIEVIRDLPLLLQLLFWYTLMQTLPGPRQAMNPVEGIFLSNRGLRLPWIQWQDAHSFALLGMVVGIIAAVVYGRSARAKQMQDGQPRKIWPAAVGLVIGLPLVIWAAWGAPFQGDVPALRGFNFQGGMSISPEYFALLAGLVTYTAGFIAEIVRAGIQAVPGGQWEASEALGLQRGRIMRLVVLPQALRVIIPPMTSQYLNLTKNSSLAVAIGYQDIVSIANTTLNQTGQAIEGIAIIMGVYLTISLSISLFMNWYNARIALVER
jgi:general L-amino acid transport system permease protein